MMLRQMRIAGAPCGLLVRITAPTYTSAARDTARRLPCVSAVGRRVHCLRPWGGGHPASSGPLLGPCIVSASRPPIATGHARLIRQFSVRQTLASLIDPKSIGLWCALSRGRNIHCHALAQMPQDFSTKYRDEIQDLTDKFLEAKDSIEDANDSFETTYFDEDMDDAREAVCRSHSSHPR
jgi:hypothetical protein